MPLWYTLSCTTESSGNALEMANLFFESDLFSAAEPDLMGDGNDINCASDPLFNGVGSNRQWNLIDKLNICPAWQVTTSCDETVVAVIDSGIELSHPDLIGNIHNISYDTESGTSPSKIVGLAPNHGTLCAGIIAAKSNAIGIAGVAPNSKLMSISNSMATTPNSRQKRADGISFAWQNGADIISNSWSWAGTGYQIIDDAISNAVTFGRNGLGCVVVFSVGTTETGGTYIVNYPGNNQLVIAAGAVDLGEDKYDSNYGNDIDVVAPGRNIWSTDLNGSYSLFGGSSTAAPHVAGLAALILSIKPGLNQAQVRNFIEGNTDKIQGAGLSYLYSYNKPNGSWNYYVGYGRINAQKAVAAVSSGLGNYSISGPDVLCNGQYSLYPSKPSWANVTWSASSGVAINSTSGIATVLENFAGQTSVTATLYGACPLFTASKQIWSGPPANFYPAGYSEECSSIPILFNAYSDPISDVNNFRWYLDGAYIAESPNNYIQLYAPIGGHRIELQASNGCGWSEYKEYQDFTIFNCAGFAVTPNPADSKITVKLGKLGTKKSLTLFRSDQVKMYQSDTLDDTFSINCTNIGDGNYILNITIDGKTSSEHIIIKH
jgi:hypothetical protein